MNWRFGAVEPTRLTGRFWRMLAPRWAFDPLSGAGAARFGGRWNAPGQPALYLSDSHATAIAEYQQELPRPGTLTAYDIDAASILDLSEPAVRSVLGMGDEFLRLPWKHARDVEKTRPASWDFAEAAVAAGFDGVRTFSVQTNGRNLVLWRWNGADQPMVRHLDPLGELPSDQASWPRSLL